MVIERRPLLVSAMTYAAITMVMGRQVIDAIGSSIAGDPGDPLLTAAILSNHRRTAPFGAAGGEDGATGVNRIERSDGTHEALASTAEVRMAPGDVFVIETPGGGGYGPKKAS